MRLTTRTNLAMRVLMYCGINAETSHRSADIAEACNVSANHLMQVVPVLHRAGFVHATRGRAGGVRLATPPDRIVVGRVFRMFEAGLPFAECFAPEGNSCPLTEHCRLRAALARALGCFYDELDRITLGDLIAGNCGLEALLACHRAAVPVACGVRASGAPAAG